MHYAIVTFGCRLNQADSLELEEALLDRGAKPSAPVEADLILINTCSVTASADQGARQTVRRLARENPGARIVVTGCYATRRPDDVRELPGVVRVAPNTDKGQLIPLLWRDLIPPIQTTAERFGGGSGPCGNAIEPGVAGRTAYTLRVQTGCEEVCAYCIIPATRGPSRSRTLDEVLSEVDRVVAAGFKDVALTGVHLGAFGRDLRPPSTLVALLRALASRPGDYLLRISSLEPMDCHDEVVDLLGTYPQRFAPHVHLPLQHASGVVLRAMRRPYTLEYYDRLVAGIRYRLPHAAIGSDVIVGFPGETEREFQENAAYLARSPLTYLHVFPYSDRPGTTASAMPAKVPGGVIRERAREIRAIAQRLTERFRRSQLGTLRPGLTVDDGTLVVTDNYFKVRIAPGLPRNERVTVRIVDAGEVMTGEVI